jgi:hypothetical protein
MASQGNCFSSASSSVPADSPLRRSPRNRAGPNGPAADGNVSGPSGAARPSVSTSESQSTSTPQAETISPTKSRADRRHFSPAPDLFTVISRDANIQLQSASRRPRADRDDTEPSFSDLFSADQSCVPAQRPPAHIRPAFYNATLSRGRDPEAPPVKDECSIGFLLKQSVPFDTYKPHNARALSKPVLDQLLPLSLILCFLARFYRAYKTVLKVGTITHNSRGEKLKVDRYAPASCTICGLTIFGFFCSASYSNWRVFYHGLCPCPESSTLLGLFEQEAATAGQIQWYINFQRQAHELQSLAYYPYSKMRHFCRFQLKKNHFFDFLSRDELVRRCYPPSPCSLTPKKHFRSSLTPKKHFRSSND